VRRLAGMRGFLRLKGLALAQNAVRLFRIWVWPGCGAAVGPVIRLRMPSNAYFGAHHNRVPDGHEPMIKESGCVLDTRFRFASQLFSR
jgi:hypothetical protein